MVQNPCLPKTSRRRPYSHLTPLAALIWHPKPLPGLRELISEHRKEAVPVWAEGLKEQVGGTRKAGSHLLRGTQQMHPRGGEESQSRAQEPRVLLHCLCTFGKSQTPYRQILVPMT